MFRFVTGKFPVTSAVARFTALLVAVWVEPAKCAMPTPGDDAATHVGQAIVPDEVIVPPVIGEVVAMLVTDPPPLTPPDPLTTQLPDCGTAKVKVTTTLDGFTVTLFG